MSTTAKRIRVNRCSRCSLDKGSNQKYCNDCIRAKQRIVDAMEANKQRLADERRRLAIRELFIRQLIADMRSEMTPIVRSVKTNKVDSYGVTVYKKKQFGWRCKSCGVSCEKQCCVVCEREVK
jgi:hypothetical protein